MPQQPSGKPPQPMDSSPPQVPGSRRTRAAQAHDNEPGRNRWLSNQLLGHRNEIEILHSVSVYRLRVTSLGKLILTK